MCVIPHVACAGAGPTGSSFAGCWNQRFWTLCTCRYGQTTVPRLRRREESRRTARLRTTFTQPPCQIGERSLSLGCTRPAKAGLNQGLAIRPAAPLAAASVGTMVASLFTLAARVGCVRDMTKGRALLTCSPSCLSPFPIDSIHASLPTSIISFVYLPVSVATSAASWPTRSPSREGTGARRLTFRGEPQTMTKRMCAKGSVGAFKLWVLQGMHTGEPDAQRMG